MQHRLSVIGLPHLQTLPSPRGADRRAVRPGRAGHGHRVHRHPAVDGALHRPLAAKPDPRGAGWQHRPGHRPPAGPGGRGHAAFVAPGLPALRVARTAKRTEQLRRCQDHEDLLAGRQNLLQAELTEANDRFDKIQEVINLYHALGGGIE